jgi:hypothetical protein
MTSPEETIQPQNSERSDLVSLLDRRLVEMSERTTTNPQTAERLKIEYTRYQEVLGLCPDAVLPLFRPLAYEITKNDSGVLESAGNQLTDTLRLIKDGKILISSGRKPNESVVITAEREPINNGETKQGKLPEHMIQNALADEGKFAVRELQGQVFISCKP